MNSIMSMVRGKTLLRAETSESPSDDEANSDATELLSLAWNQDWTCFIAGTDKGFNVYGSKRIKENFKSDPLESDIITAKMLFDCQYYALVSSGCKRPEYPPNKVIIWDDTAKKIHGEINLVSEVIDVKLAVKLGNELYAIVVLRQNIYVYFFYNCKVYRQVKTISNTRGLCCVSQGNSNTILACPGIRPGQVQVLDVERNKIHLFKAHDSGIACMTLTLDGSLLATASTKGTLIRIFNALDGTLLQEFRRGIERAEIYSLAISLDQKWVAVSSDKGTLHVFRLRPDILSISTDINPASSSSLTFVRGFLPKYDNERSFAQLSLPTSTKFIVGFGSHKASISKDGQVSVISARNGCSLENTVLVLGADGSFRRCRFDEEGGPMVELEHKRFLSLPVTETDDTMVVM